MNGKMPWNTDSKSIEDLLASTGCLPVEYGGLTALGRSDDRGGNSVAHFIADQAESQVETLAGLGVNASVRPTALPGKYVVVFDPNQRKIHENGVVHRIEAVGQRVDGLTRALMQVLELIAAGNATDAKTLAAATLHKAGLRRPPAAKAGAVAVDVVQVPSGVLAVLIEMANAHIEDIETGLEDGTYVRSENGNLPDKQAAVKEAEKLYRSAHPQTRSPQDDASPEPMTST
ncbi:hypothetical protein LMG22037_05539 [Paraburkholderia phenoliruptrix]|jgi:hypothetical protein|uniref:Uncharacterized protein n=1 Tax=Paraburkholderia phenoliruptrix TaxID=252970 RepID=A0A6J5C985_9BURK|nr:hypothetical protein [Paraburkholderia phenoliruptrix]CAB3730523.1 hypothetical protein LMG22037_05539 [Paraburkholderia phenoliruptrix]